MSPQPQHVLHAALSRLSWIGDMPRQAMLLVVRAYRLLLKPWLGNACRFEPTCSQYALDALQRHGAIAGGTLAAGRLLRCHPWCDGGIDPVPERAPGLFTRLGLGAQPSPAGDDHATMPPIAPTEVVRKPVP